MAGVGVVRGLGGGAEDCKLIAGLFAMLVQAVLVAVCVLTLVVKRALERPQRDILTWFFDFGKQGLGSAVSHFTNIALAVSVSSTIRDSNECEWYLLSYVSDSTVGLLLNLGLLYIAERLQARISPSTVTGFYGSPPQIALFFPQLMVWLVIILVSKILLLALLVHFALPLNTSLHVIFASVFPTQSPEVELVTVMVFIPTISNVLYFWITDSCIKNSSKGAGGGPAARRQGGLNYSKLSLTEGLLQVPSAELEKVTDAVVSTTSSAEDWIMSNLQQLKLGASRRLGADDEAAGGGGLQMRDFVSSSSSSSSSGSGSSNGVV